MAVTSAQVQELYVGLLGRAADKAGLDYWVGQLNATGSTLTLENLRANFVNEQPEYAATYGNLARADLVKAIYTNLFERTPTAEEVNYWANGSVSADQMVVAFLNGASTADQQVVSNKVFVAQAYTSAAGANFKADAAAKVIADVNGSVTTVNAALATLPTSTETVAGSLAAVVSAQAAVTADVDAWGAAQTPVKAAGIATVADVHQAVDAAEAAVDAFLVTNGAVLTGTAVVANSYDSVAATDTYSVGDAPSAYGQQNVLEDANLAVIKAKIAAQKTTLDAAVTGATTTLQGLSNGAQLKAAVDAVLVAQAGVVAATTAAANATAATASAANALVAASDAVTAASFAGNVITVKVDGVDYTSSYNTTTKTWANNNVVLNSVNLADVQAKAVAQLTASDAVTNANALVSARMLAVEKIDATQTDGVAFTGAVGQVDANQNGWDDAGEPGALLAEAVAYADAKSAVTDFGKLVDGLNKAIAAVDAARADSAELAGLEAKVAAANKVLTDAGLNVVSVANGDVEFATTKSDVFQLEATLSGATVKDGAASIYSFANGDILSVGTKYALGTASDVQKGNDALLEIFFTQNGANTDVTIETQAFGDTANANAVSVITLVGVDASALSLANGLIQFA